MNEPRVIKRYANRKLYDSSESRYVTLSEVEQMVRVASMSKSSTTKRRKTSRPTLAQLVRRTNVKRRCPSLATLKQLVQAGGIAFEKSHPTREQFEG